MNQSKLAKNCLLCTSNRLAPPMSFAKLAFSWPRLPIDLLHAGSCVLLDSVTPSTKSLDMFHFTFKTLYCTILLIGAEKCWGGTENSWTTSLAAEREHSTRCVSIVVITYVWDEHYTSELFQCYTMCQQILSASCSYVWSKDGALSTTDWGTWLSLERHICWVSHVSTEWVLSVLLVWCHSLSLSLPPHPHPSPFSSDIIEILQLQYKPFLLLAAQLQVIHEQVQVQLLEYSISMMLQCMSLIPIHWRFRTSKSSTLATGRCSCRIPLMSLRSGERKTKLVW